MNYVLGIDGGGTKTLLCAADTNGKELFLLEGGAINMNGLAPKTVAANIACLLTDAIGHMSTNDCLVSVCLGAAGISNPAASATLLQGITKAGVACPVKLVGDHITALYGALDGEAGILLIAGTGSICVALGPNGDTARSGGRGHLIDDEGSGYAIGRDILSAVMRAYDRRLAPTVLTEAVLDTLQIGNIEEIIPYVYSLPTDKSKLACLAKLLPAACEAKDAAALAIREKAARELAALSCAVCKALGLHSAKLAISGSILLKDLGLQAEFIRYITQDYPELSIIKPINDAAHGAVILALKALQ